MDRGDGRTPTELPEKTSKSLKSPGFLEYFFFTFFRFPLYFFTLSYTITTAGGRKAGRPETPRGEGNRSNRSFSKGDESHDQEMQAQGMLRTRRLRARVLRQSLPARSRQAGLLQTIQTLHRCPARRGRGRSDLRQQPRPQASLAAQGPPRRQPQYQLLRGVQADAAEQAHRLPRQEAGKQALDAGGQGHDGLRPPRSPGHAAGSTIWPRVPAELLRVGQGHRGSLVQPDAGKPTAERLPVPDRRQQ